MNRAKEALVAAIAVYRQEYGGKNPKDGEIRRKMFEHLKQILPPTKKEMLKSGKTMG